MVNKDDYKRIFEFKIALLVAEGNRSRMIDNTYLIVHSAAVKYSSFV